MTYSLITADIEATIQANGKVKTLEGLGFVPAFKGTQPGMILERIAEAKAKIYADALGGVAVPPEFSTWWGWDVFVPVSAEEA